MASGLWCGKNGGSPRCPSGFQRKGGPSAFMAPPLSFEMRRNLAWGALCFANPASRRRRLSRPLRVCWPKNRGAGPAPEAFFLLHARRGVLRGPWYVIGWGFLFVAAGGWKVSFGNFPLRWRFVVSWGGAGPPFPLYFFCSFFPFYF